MLLKRLISIIGSILIIAGTLLITANSPVTVFGPLLIIAGLVLALLSAFPPGRC